MGRSRVGHSLIGVAALIAVAWTTLFVLAVSALPDHDRRAVQVEATVSRGGRIPCSDRPNPVQLSFDWKGRSIQEPYYGGFGSCDQAFVVGQKVTVFVDTLDPSNIGPTERWITHPDEHDPFDVGVGGAVVLLAALWFGGVVAAVLIAWVGLRVARRPAVSSLR